ncbi:MAG: hypothetical protein IJW21_01120 [Clostridia bacterium]|nr:hypothetical protein [Clostridia bacterium]
MSVYDLYDIYAVIVYIRAYPDDAKIKDVAKVVKRLLDEPREDSGGFNNVRRAIAAIDGVDRERWHWAFVENDYTYIPGFIKNELHYSVLSAGFAEMIFAMEGGDGERLYLAADAMHNVPIIFAHNDIKEAKKHIKREISFYRGKYNKEFLREWI